MLDLSNEEVTVVDSKDESEDKFIHEAQPLPSVHLIEGMFRDLKTMANNCNKEGVIMHLRGELAEHSWIQSDTIAHKTHGSFSLQS